MSEVVLEYAISLQRVIQIYGAMHRVSRLRLLEINVATLTLSTTIGVRTTRA